MNPKKLLTVLSLSLLIPGALPHMAFGEGEAAYIYTYYNDSGVLIDAATFRDGSPEAYAPPEAVTAKLFQRGETLIFAGDVRLSHDAAPTGSVKNTESVPLAPYVTPEMCTAAYWQDRPGCTDSIVMTEPEIQAFNRKILDTPETFTNDLSALTGVYDGKALAEANAEFASPAGLYLHGEPVSEDYYQAIRENIRTAPVTAAMPYKYGFAVNRTVMKAYPYADFLSDDPADPEWDNLVSSAVSVNEPLVLLFSTADGKFTLAVSQCCSGWVPTEDIAVCTGKEEWEALRNPENFLVVTGEKVYLEPSADPDLNEKLLTMGTVLPLSEETGPVAFRLPWNNYVVKLPARAQDGSFYQKNAMIPVNRDVHIGYLPYTTANVVTQAFKSLGNRYGWGGMLNSQDCSSYAREVYQCFGLNLPRNTAWQSAMPARVTVMSEMTAEQKSAVLDTLPAGSILIFPGHEMLYLGKENGRYYTINDVSSLVRPDAPGKIIRPRSVVVNDLSTLRGDGSTWLDNLSHAVAVREP